MSKGKPGKGKGKGGPVEPDDSTEKLYRAYRKKLTEYG
jgi:Ran GTPase-activating protein (RanGAP) involved in mRNA processing and transport